MHVEAGLLDDGAGRVLLHQDHLDPAGGLDLCAELLAAARVLHGVGDVVERVEVARLHARVAALVEVDELAVAEGVLVEALLRADQEQALVLPVVDDVGGALQRELFGHGVESRRGALARALDHAGDRSALADAFRPRLRRRLARPSATSETLGSTIGSPG